MLKSYNVLKDETIIPTKPHASPCSLKLSRLAVLISRLAVLNSRLSCRAQYN